MQRGFHALLWLVYSYAQQGRYDDARGVLAQIEAAAKESGSVRTRSHLALARAAWLIETRKWGEAKAPVVSKGLPKDAAIAELFAIGFAAVRIGQSPGAAERDAADGGADGRSAGQRRPGAQRRRRRQAAPPGVSPIAAGPGRRARHPAPRPIAPRRTSRATARTGTCGGRRDCRPPARRRPARRRR